MEKDVTQPVSAESAEQAVQAENTAENTAAPSEKGGAEGGGAPKKKSLKWLWITLAVLIAAGIAAWCIVCALKVEEDSGVEAAFNVSEVIALLTGMFIVAFLGYMLGRITIKGVSLGTAGVFLVAILFGYLCTLPWLKNVPIFDVFYMESTESTLNGYFEDIVQNIGLILFVAAVGFIAGPSFFKNLKKNAKSYVLLGLIIIISGGVIAALFTIIPGITPEFSAGILSGALTTTPGFSAAKEAAAENLRNSVTLGHAIAYPFGVVGVVLFVQLMPKFLKADMNKERTLLSAGKQELRVKREGLLVGDSFGLTPFSLAVICGIALGSITIPLTGAGYDGACFSLGNTGGVLIMCLIFGHFGRIGKLSLEVPEKTIKSFREFGLMLFLIGAGVSGGVSLVSEIGKSELGGWIVLYGFIAGVLMTVIPMFIGFFIAKKWLKISLLNNLGSITGGMTSTPALGTLINVAGTDDVASAYAATYPIALVSVVLVSQFLVILL